MSCLALHYGCGLSLKKYVSASYVVNRGRFSIAPDTALVSSTARTRPRMRLLYLSLISFIFLFLIDERIIEGLKLILTSMIASKLKLSTKSHLNWKLLHEIAVRAETKCSTQLYCRFITSRSAHRAPAGWGWYRLSFRCLPSCRCLQWFRCHKSYCCPTWFHCLR